MADEFGVADSTVLRLARRQCWEERFVALERPVKEAGDEMLRQAVQEMNERHIAVARTLVEKGAEALCLLQPSSVAEALRLVETGAKLERQARGEPDSKKQVTVETILRERFEALVVHEDARTIDAQSRRMVTIDVPSLGDADSGDEEGGVTTLPSDMGPRRGLGIFEGLATESSGEQEMEE